MEKQHAVCVLNFFVVQNSWFSSCVPAAGSNAAGQAPGLVTTLPLMLCKQTNKQAATFSSRRLYAFAK